MTERITDKSTGGFRDFPSLLKPVVYHTDGFRRPEGDYIRISNAEYLHLAKMKKQLQWNRNIRNRNPLYLDIIKQMPTCGVTSADRYVQNLKYIQKHCDGLLAFECVKGFRNVGSSSTYIAIKRFIPFARGSQMESRLCLDWEIGASRTVALSKGTPWHL